MNNNKTMSELFYSKAEIERIVKERTKWFREMPLEEIRNRQEYKLTAKNIFK